MIKKYEHKPANFIEAFDYIEEDGSITRFNFKASLEVFILFKSITGECLTVGLDRYQQELVGVGTSEDFELLTNFTLETEEGKSKLLEEKGPELKRALSQANKKINDIHIYENGMEFSDAIIHTMYVASLPKEIQDEAIAIGIESLPQEVYQDIGLFPKLIARLLKTKTELKKKHLLKDL